MDIPASTLWPLILTSAAVAAIVSSVATLVGQFLERRSRRRELLLTHALELSRRHVEKLVKMSSSVGRPVPVHDEIVTVESYYQWLEALLDAGRLPADKRIEKPPSD